MTRLSLEQKMRSGHVKRWQIVRVAREQTIAEHMYRVFLITKEICFLAKVPSYITEMSVEWALSHDLPEVVTGDLATPVKLAMRKAVPDDDPVRHIELSLDREYKMLYLSAKEQYPLVLDIVKIADLLEATDFMVSEGLGRHAGAVLTGLRSALTLKLMECSKLYPEFDWSFIYLMLPGVFDRGEA